MSQNAARAVYRNVIDNELEARRAIARFIDGSAESYTGMREVNDAGDVPGR